MKHAYGKMKKGEVDGCNPEMHSPPKNSSHTPSNPSGTPSDIQGPLASEPTKKGAMWEYNETPSKGGKTIGGVEANDSFI